MSDWSAGRDSVLNTHGSTGANYYIWRGWLSGSTYYASIESSTWLVVLAVMLSMMLAPLVR
ncbi:hypothetical protein [Halomonas huangheensis]|uniref:hypothetical protein n=1 Tax=Halomonas huangheensis TaxID=1178482 RepID=UPI0009DBE30E